MSYADDGAGAPIVLVHGWAGSGAFFADLAKRLSKTHRVLTLTLRGHPGSEPGNAPLSIETLADDIAHFFDALDLRGAVALGWSMGAMALWAAAPKLAGRIDGIIVEEMAPRIVNDGDWQCGLSGGYAAADIDGTVSEIRAGWPAYVARLTPRMFAPTVRETRADLVAWTAAEMAKADGAAMASFWTSMARQDFRRAVSYIAVPMLVIHGADSLIYPDGATDFVACAAPKGQRIVLSGAGHVPHLEQPDAFFEHVENFARTVRRADVMRGGTP